MGFGEWKLKLESSPHDVRLGVVNISCNNPKEPSSYMTCILGAPLDGLRCKLHSYLSVRNDLTIEARKLSDIANDSESDIVASLTAALAEPHVTPHSDIGGEDAQIEEVAGKAHFCVDVPGWTDTCICVWTDGSGRSQVVKKGEC